MNPFVSSHKMKCILVVVDYMLKWVEAIALSNNKGKSVTAFLKKNILSRLGTPRDIISDGDPTFATICSKGYWRNMGFTIMWLIRTICRLVGKLRFPIEI